MAEIQHYPNREKGRAQRTTLMAPPFRFSPANDNKRDGLRWSGWLIVALLAGAVAAGWLTR